MTKLWGDVVDVVSTRDCVVVVAMPAFCRAGSDGLPTEGKNDVRPPEEDSWVRANRTR